MGTFGEGFTVSVIVGEDYATILVFLVRDRHEKRPVCQKGQKVIDCSIDNFRTHVCSYQAEGSTILNSRQPREILCRKKKRSAGSVWRPFSEGLEVRDALFSIPTFGGTLSMKLLMGNFFRLSPMRGEIFWQKMPRVRKVSSVPNQEETTILFIDYPKYTNREVCMKTKQHEPGVVSNLTSARTGLHFPQNSADDHILNSRWTKNSSARWFREFGYRAIRWKQKKHREQCLVYKDFFFRHRSQKILTRTTQKSSSKFVEVHIGIMTQAPYIAQKRTEWQKEPSAEWKNEHCRTSVKIGLPEQCGIVQRNILVICATGAIKMTDDKTAFEERDDK